jgi:hypothetical protein
MKTIRVTYKGEQYISIAEKKENLCTGCFFNSDSRCFFDNDSRGEDCYNMRKENNNLSCSGLGIIFKKDTFREMLIYCLNEKERKV